MRGLLFISVLLFAQISAAAQPVGDKQLQIEQVQTAVGSLVGKSQRAQVMLRDLSELQGAVTALFEDSFNFKIKGANGKRVTATIAYQDVLEIKSEKISLSLVPDPLSRPFGSWDEVLKISYNNYLEIVLENGQSVTGRTGEITKDKLILFNSADNEKLLLPRDQIVYVYRVRRQSGKSGDAVAGSSRKGGNIGREIGPTPTGKLIGGGLGTLIGAGVGAIAGAAKQEKKLRVLIYSK